IPLLLMGGIVGRLFREFAVTMTVAIAFSLAISLTGTPMMCAHLLKPHADHGRLYLASERAFAAILATYRRTLDVALRFSLATLPILMVAIALNVYLFVHIPKGFFPQQDTGRLTGSIQADQASSFQVMDGLLHRMIGIVKADPAVADVVGFTGGGGGGTTTNTAPVIVRLERV